ncbi:hypothetical protein LTR08_009330 [Meristemomyces frigidus]|nr:hypothetical protein LTR08_009330 [Meristemomyces frigidus]
MAVRECLPTDTTAAELDTNIAVTANSTEALMNEADVTDTAAAALVADELITGNTATDRCSNEVVPTDGTAGRTFNTTELLEHICTSLSLTDLIHAQRVSKQWYTTIKGSPKLKENLFLSAAPRRAYYKWDFKNGGLHVTQQLAVGTNTIITRLHPCVKRNRINHKGYVNCNMLVGMDYIELARWSLGPWQDMLLMQPPCQMIDVRLAQKPLDGEQFHRDVTREVRLRDDQGIRLGMLRESAMALQNSTKGLKWNTGPRGRYPRHDDYVTVITLVIRDFIDERCLTDFSYPTCPSE